MWVIVKSNIPEFKEGELLTEKKVSFLRETGWQKTEEGFFRDESMIICEKVKNIKHF